MAGRGRALTAKEIAWAIKQRLRDYPMTWVEITCELRVDATWLKAHMPPETKHNRLMKRAGRRKGVRNTRPKPFTPSSAVEAAIARDAARLARIDARVDADGIPLCRRWM